MHQNAFVMAIGRGQERVNEKRKKRERKGERKNDRGGEV